MSGPECILTLFYTDVSVYDLPKVILKVASTLFSPKSVNIIIIHAISLDPSPGFEMRKKVHMDHPTWDILSPQRQVVVLVPGLHWRLRLW